MKHANFILFFVLIVSGCVKKEVISNILIDRVAVGQQDSMIPLREKLYNTTLEAVKKSSYFTFDKKSKQDKVLRIIATPEPAGIDISARLEGIVQTDYESELLMPGNNNLSEIIDRLLTRIDSNLNPERQQVSKHITALKTYVEKENNVSAALNAVKVIERHGNQEGIVLLEKVLSSTNMNVALAALDALAKVGNEKSSVHAIIQFSERKESETRQKAIDAVEKIGGREAAAWLFMLSTGHHDEIVRKNAEVALNHVEKRLAVRNN